MDTAVLVALALCVLLLCALLAAAWQDPEQAPPPGSSMDL